MMKKQLKKLMVATLILSLTSTGYVSASPCSHIPPGPSGPVPGDHDGCIAYWNQVEASESASIDCALFTTLEACLLLIWNPPAYTACDAGAAAGAAVQYAALESIVELNELSCPPAGGGGGGGTPPPE